MMLESECPACKATNWTYVYDGDDCTNTQGTRQACRCWKCGERFWLCGPEYLEELDEEERDLATADHEDGTPTPESHSIYFEYFLNLRSEKYRVTWREFIYLKFSKWTCNHMPMLDREERQKCVVSFMRDFPGFEWRKDVIDAFNGWHLIRPKDTKDDRELLHGLCWSKSDGPSAPDRHMQRLLEYMYGVLT